VPPSERRAGEDERGEVPDRFLRTEFPESAAGEAAADREGEGDELAAKERGQTHKKSDCGSRVWAGNQTGHERPFEREVGGVVPQEQPSDYGYGQRNA
jgi:hypothetical protein